MRRPQGEETARVLELWQDTVGKKKGDKYFAGRYLFYPRHLPPKHTERRRKRTGIDAKQVRVARRRRRDKPSR